MDTKNEKLQANPRAICAIAAEIRRTWRNVYFGAVPYLDAMMELDRITDRYMADDARGIVSYFLSNARTWKGPDAKRLKQELKELLQA